ncbi:hypothetical protein AB3515_03710 [Acinetobacter baumannii]
MRYGDSGFCAMYVLGMPRVDYDEQLASHREGLLDIAKRAGYQVTWIDNNSGCKGACDRVEQYQIPENLKKNGVKMANVMMTFSLTA